jgi:hypothetical protein
MPDKYSRQSRIFRDLEIQDVCRVAIDDENNPATLGFWNIQSYLLASLEEVCRSVRFNLKELFSLEDSQPTDPRTTAAVKPAVFSVSAKDHVPACSIPWTLLASLRTVFPGNKSTERLS